LQNGGGISAGNYFSMDKFMDQVHVSVDRPGVLGPSWTDGGVNRGGRGTAARSPELGLRRSGAPKLADGGAKGREEHGELGGGTTRSRETRWRGFLTRERRGEGRGEVWSAPGVIGWLL
jgi:hypothetical protein